MTPSLPLIVPAHETWFEQTEQARDWGFLVQPLTLALVLGTVAVAVGWRYAAGRLPTPELGVLRPVGRLAPWVPRLLGIHLGVSLLALAATGGFMTPAIGAGTPVLLLEAALGVWLVSGWQLRSAAWLVLGLGPLLALVSSWVTLLECANLAAVAAFLVVVPSGPDDHGRAHPSPRHLRLALLLMRLGVGSALITLAFTEKLTHPALALETLDHYPALNVFSLVGVPVPDEAFVAIAGATELLFGLLVVSGALPQVAVLVAAIPFNATLLLFGQTELVGHLPVYGVFLALLVYGSQPANAPLVSWLPRPRRTPRAVTRAGVRDAEPSPLQGDKR